MTNTRVLHHYRNLPVAIKDLSTLWVTITVSLVFLEYPLLSSVLVATTVVLQASLGLQVLIRVFRIESSSLIWLTGPGVIVGGSLSFLLFQLVGRGLLGLGFSCAVGGFAAIFTARDRKLLPESISRSASTTCIVGLASLGMSSIFEWLLPVATLALLAVCLLDSKGFVSSVTRSLLVCSLAITITVSLLFRGDSWWLISDDYKFFETLSGHLAISGPTADWGSVNFLRYHWLSYGWSGLLDFAALQPETLSTLTKVMPLIYSLSLAASLLAITQYLVAMKKLTALKVLPAWAFVAMFQLDWSGTSTAASLSVLTSTVAIFMAFTNSPSSFWRRSIAYAAAIAIVTLTKFPSVITLIPLVACTETLCRGRKTSSLSRAPLTILAVCLVSGFTLAMLPSLSFIVGGYSLEWGDQRGDELGRRGLSSSLLFLAGRETWIVAVIVLGWFMLIRQRRSDHKFDPALLLLCLAPLVLAGVVMDAVVVGVANTNEYFSGPAHFVVGLSLLVFSRFLPRLDGLDLSLKAVINWLLIAGAVVVFTFSLRSVPLTGVGLTILLRDTLTDPRLILCLICLAVFVSHRNASDTTIETPLIVLFAMCIFVGSLPIMAKLVTNGFKSDVSQLQLTELLGPPDSRTAGTWLGHNSNIDDLIATNFLRDREGEFTSDYSLAMWSGREFLVLGPRLTFDSTSIPASVRASEEFAASASSSSAGYLLGQGVDWFIVDLDTTSLRSWEPYADVVAMTWRFWVLKMRP